MRARETFLLSIVAVFVAASDRAAAKAGQVTDGGPELAALRSTSSAVFPTDGPDAARTIPAVLVRELLTRRPCSTACKGGWQAGVPSTVHIENAIVVGDLVLRAGEVESEVELIACDFKGEVHLDRTSLVPVWNVGPW